MFYQYYVSSFLKQNDPIHPFYDKHLSKFLTVHFTSRMIYTFSNFIGASLKLEAVFHLPRTNKNRFLAVSILWLIFQIKQRKLYLKRVVC